MLVKNHKQISGLSFSLAEMLLLYSGEKVYRLKSEVPTLPDDFTSSPPLLHSFRSADVIAAYRDDRREMSIHALELPDRWEFHIDQVNPQADPVAHLIEDAPVETVAALIIAKDLLS
jgi:hypothetical protein